MDYLMVDDSEWENDSQKLRVLADWFDLQDKIRGVVGIEGTGVQGDLRRIADELEKKETRELKF